MIKKFLSLLLACVLIILTLCSCGDDDISLVMAINSDPECLDPQIAETQTAKTIINNCYEGLVRLNNKGEPVSGVAKSWTVSENGLVYTFTLREDTHWQLLKAYKDVLDDENYMENFKTEVTAHDFEFALKRAVDKITDSPDADKLFCIKNAQKIHNGETDKSALGVKAIDDHTLEITLERANPDFLRVLTLPLCMPCNEEFFNATKAKYGLELKYTFCNGPFYLGRWSTDHSIVMYKNEGYKGLVEVKPTSVYLNVNTDESSVITKLNQNDYNCAYLSDSAIFNLPSDTKIRTEAIENSVSGFVFNCEDQSLSNENLRKALVMLTKTESISKPSQAVGAASGIVPTTCRFGNSNYRTAAGSVAKLRYDEDAALELWKTGLKEIGKDSAEIKIICTDEYAAQMQNAIQDWQRVLATRIVAKVEVVNKETLDTRIKEDNFQIAVTEIKAESSSPTDMLKIFTTGNKNNIFNHSNTSYDELLLKIINQASGDEIIKSIKTAEQYLINTAVFLPLFNHSDYIALSSEATGIYSLPSFEGINFINGGLS